MTTAYVLVFLGVMSRLLPHAPNAVALGATALYAGARLPRRWALVVPLAILALSDAVIDMNHGYPFHPGSRLTTYALFAGLAFAGTLAPKHAGFLTRAGMSVLGSTVFFLVSNLVVWFEGSGLGFPLTLSGLIGNYTVALPFYRNMLLADLLGTGLLFGVDALACRLGYRTIVEEQPAATTAAEAVA